MHLLREFPLRKALHLTTAIAGLSLFHAARADSAALDAAGEIETIVVTDTKTTRSSVDLSGSEIQALLPGENPLKAIETLPGVVFMTADPWGSNEQNESLYIHGFNFQQLGYTLDGVPLGDANYGEWNGLGLSRAVISETVARVNLATGAGSLGIASTSNLGGAVETFTSDPRQDLGGQLNQTFGSYDAYRTFVRLDTGNIGFNSTAYVSYLHQDARAWDFQGQQGGDQVNAKFVHDGADGKFTLFGDFSLHTYPNEDVITLGPGTANAPYTRPFQYPNLAAYEAYVAGSPGFNPQKGPLGNYFPNYFSAEQREDELTYAKYDWSVADDVKWTNQGYFQNSRGRGIVGGPAATSVPTYLPVGGTTSTSYFAGLTPQQVVNAYGGSGIAVRTTEYSIDRSGFISNLGWQLGGHMIETGLWFENNFATQMRRWYPFSSVNTDLTPYAVPSAPSTISAAAALALLQSGATLGNTAITQYGFHSDTRDLQYHLQDQWQALPDLLVSAGIKSTLQWAAGDFVVQQPGTPLPGGVIDSHNYFLPEVGAIYDVTRDDHLFFNIQENLHQLMVYGAGALSAWSTQSQGTFDQFKANSHPESAWVYEAGYRFKHDLGTGWLTGVEGQAEYYHVDFSNRLLNITSNSTTGLSILGTFTAPQTLLVNVGGVTTNGVDVAATLHFGDHFSLYDGISYNHSAYDSDYCSSIAANGACTAGKTVSTSGKIVAADPEWTDKVVLSASYGAWEGQVTGDYVGKRFATYTNDQSVGATFVMGLQAAYTLREAFRDNQPHAVKFSLNVTNLTNERGWSTITPAASGNFTAYPLAPRMVFGTVAASF
jgi:iron complex outermembrane receptor protein